MALMKIKFNRNEQHVIWPLMKSFLYFLKHFIYVIESIEKTFSQNYILIFSNIFLKLHWYKPDLAVKDLQ